ncbi:MAG: hypothetical protein IJS39_05745 [Synergistaceae bacterium]|nr:hypothetical protein [Synergistaceae bacterium]
MSAKYSSDSEKPHVLNGGRYFADMRKIFTVSSKNLVHKTITAGQVLTN